MIVFSHDADADREFLGNLLGSRSVDAGNGWLIFALPPAEVAVHPTIEQPAHELYLMCDDINATVAGLLERGITTEGGVPPMSWGMLTTIRLPSGAGLGLYQPRHPVAAHGA